MDDETTDRGFEKIEKIFQKIFLLWIYCMLKICQNDDFFGKDFQWPYGMAWVRTPAWWKFGIKFSLKKLIFSELTN